MILVGIEMFKEHPKRYLDFALNGEPIEILSRDGKTIRLELKGEKK